MLPERCPSAVWTGWKSRLLSLRAVLRNAKTVGRICRAVLASPVTYLRLFACLAHRSAQLFDSGGVAELPAQRAAVGNQKLTARRALQLAAQSTAGCTAFCTTRENRPLARKRLYPQSAAPNRTHIAGHPKRQVETKRYRPKQRFRSRCSSTEMMITRTLSYFAE